MSSYQTTGDNIITQRVILLWWKLRHHRELVRMSFWLGLAAKRSREVLQVTPGKDSQPSVHETRSKCPVGQPLPAPHPGTLLSSATCRAQDKGDAVTSWPCRVVCLTFTQNTTVLPAISPETGDEVKGLCLGGTMPGKAYSCRSCTYSGPASSKEQKMASLRSPAWSDRISKQHCHRQASKRGWDVWPGALADCEALGVAGNSYESHRRVPHLPLSPWASSQSLGKALWITHKTEGLFLKPCRPDSKHKCRLGKWRKGCWDSTVYQTCLPVHQCCLSPNKHVPKMVSWNEWSFLEFSPIFQ